LGDDLAKIAWEKAGIIKAGRPVVAARQMDEALGPIEAEAHALGAPLQVMGRDFDAHEERGRLMVQLEDRLLDLPSPSLFGAHQFENAGVAAAAMLALGDPRIDEAAIGRGVAAAVWPGRFQRLTKGPLAEMARARGADLWLDGAHNPHAGRALADACARLAARDGRPVRMIVGMLSRKNAPGFFSAFAGLADRVFTTSFEAASAMPADALAQAANSVGVQAQPADGVQAALAGALEGDGPAPHVLICGSLYFIGDVLALSPETWPT
ncbi:MAG TPA: cyanophycin synthetase, partial [Caulobacteraceae bacterium]|nr:cyanophycin synthetase [Caulobacteraceae bacterium]